MSTKVKGLRIIKETANATGVVRVDDPVGMDIIWLPTDQLDRITRNKDGTAEITMPDWLAEDRGL